ncbi:MarR family winged helix-turn-helix transcriptional regulator [Paenibacillus sp. 1001270B_150601_E10]|uniref:MarR family winged helix-turn-helix transcriptional regulator n=1 Tax=Paenibacillus sp. 1001270B_150601_E10 TaxID=2787079 RepID=UPI0018A096F2|nr:MarR family transcriptional regulator [Paenibacillus sp. 1001270B_150601_E10]
MDNTYLDQSAGFLLGIAYRHISNRFMQKLKPYDITSEQWSVLYQVASENGLIQKVIGDRTGKDKPTTTRLLQHLEAKGLIRRQNGEKDKRSVLVVATDKGHSLIQETIGYEMEVINEAKNAMTEEEYNQLIRLLQQINIHFTKLQDGE